MALGGIGLRSQMDCNRSKSLIQTNLVKGWIGSKANVQIYALAENENTL
jgi:hypothetical protein